MLPSPKFTKNLKLPSPCFIQPDKPKPSRKNLEITKAKFLNKKLLPHFSTPEGMLLPSNQQPPPMYGPRGSTIPPKFLKNDQRNNGYNNQNNHNRNKNNGKRQNYQNNSRKHENNTEPTQHSMSQKFWCEICDIPFPTQPQLNSHQETHQKCSIDNCSFIGNPNSLAVHIEEQHSTGMYEKIKKLNSPEEIEKWRAERKKNYPTLANVELRRQAKEERQKRGEKIFENKSRFGKPEDRRQIINEDHSKKSSDFRPNGRNLNRSDKAIKRKNASSKSFDNSNKPVHNNSKKLQTTGSFSVNQDQINGSLPKFQGTSKLFEYESKNLKKSKYENNNPLTGLLGMYGTGSDDDSSETESNNDHAFLLNSIEIENENLVKETHQNKEETKLDGYNNESKFQLNGKHGHEQQINKQEANVNSDSSIDCRSSVEIKDFQNNSQHSNLIIISKNEFSEKLKIAYDEDNSIANNELGNTAEITSPTELELGSSHDDDLPEEQPILKEFTVSNLTNSSEHLSTDKVNIKASNPNKSSKLLNAKEKCKKKTLLNYSKLRQLRNQNTMLAKLLEKDIRHERNVLLQCVRYVVQNNFFDLISEKK